MSKFTYIFFFLCYTLYGGIMHKREKDTVNKLERLSKSLDIKINKKQSKPTFNTKEVIILLILTAIIGLAMGGLVTYKLTLKENDYEDLDEFIENYEYIVDNYYGEVDKDELISNAITGMLSSLDKNSTYMGTTDSNTSIYLEGSYKGTGLQVYNDENNNIVIYQVFDGTSASKAGLKAGDIIVKLNNKDTSNMTVSSFSKLVKKQKGSFKITYKRDDKEKEVTLKVGTVELESVSYKVLDDNIGYIKVSIFATNTYEQFKKALENLESKNIKGLIIDLRDNSGGHLSSAEDIISLFLDSSHVIYQIKSKDNQVKYYSKGNKTKEYKINILVNSASASASEMVTSALSEQYGASIIGEKTYGKGTVQEMQTLTDGKQYKLTTKSWLTSKGNTVDGKGITPDYEVKDEEDNILNKALELMK